MLFLDIRLFNHESYMKEALKEAEKAGERGDLPIGAVIVHEGNIIARGSNHIETTNHNTAHAEIDAINQASSYLRKHARECVIYSTVEPCVMCLPTIVMANIRHIVFATKDHYMDTESLIESHDYLKKRVHTYIGGILEEESLKVMEEYNPKAARVVRGEFV